MSRKCSLKSLKYALLLSCPGTLAASGAITPTPLALPVGEGGIGSDDMGFAPALHKVLVPAGRSGNLDLIVKEGTMNNHGQIQLMRRLVALVLATATTAYAQSPSHLDQDGIARAMRRKGEVIGEAYKVTFPRLDLRVKAGTVLVKPALAFNNWAAFKKAGDAAITYGDLVLLEAEVNPVISKLEESGIELAALHNHLLHDNPRVMYIHFMGRGNEVEMAKGLREALALTGTPLESSRPAPAEAKPDVAKQIEKIIGYEGSMGGGVFHINVPRDDIHVKMWGVEIPGYMGMNTPLNFQIEGKKAAINGDFMLLADEVNPVIKALRANGIEVASLHNHMLDEEPRLFFMHMWAYDDAVTLAKGLRAALDRMGK
jgi:hypothetical protein